MFKLAITLSALVAAALAGNLDLNACRENFFDASADHFDSLVEICNVKSNIFGCEKVCNDRSNRVFGNDGNFDLFFFQVNKPDCVEMCDAENSMTFDDLISAGDYDYENDSRKKRAASKMKRDAEYDGEGESACHILVSLTNGCGNWN